LGGSTSYSGSIAPAYGEEKGFELLPAEATIIITYEGKGRDDIDSDDDDRDDDNDDSDRDDDDSDDRYDDDDDGDRDDDDNGRDDNNDE
jgi:hypothetical protein